MNNLSAILDKHVIELLNTIDLLSEPITIKRITEGSESQVWLVNDHYVLRIHMNADSDKVFAREIKLLELLRATPLSALILPCLWSEYLVEQKWHCALYAKAEGCSIEGAQDLVNAVTETSLTEVLQGLKNVDVERVRAFGIGDTQPLEFTNLRREAVDAWSLVRNDAALTDLSTLDIEHCLALHHGSSTSSPVLLHADLKGEHLFVRNNGRLVAVIDWTDACIGSPCVDVAGIAISTGAAVAARVGLRSGYGRVVVDEGILLARCNTVVLLAKRKSGRDQSPLPLLRTQLLRAFEEYE